jgi:hypothetical protein
MILHGKSTLEDKQTVSLTRLGTNGFTKTFFATSTTQLAEFLAAIEQRQKELVARFDRHFSKTVIIPAVRDKIHCLLPVGMLLPYLSSCASKMEDSSMLM